MVQLLFITPIAVSFLVTLVCVPYWIKRARMAQLVGIDMHKLDRRHIAEIGGVPVLIGFLAGIFVYIGIITFYFHLVKDNYQTLSIITTVLIAAMIGLIDDILGWKIGLRQWQKPVLTLFASIPLIVVNAGYSDVGLPLFGTVELSYLYPFLVVPLGVVGAANGFNMIGGYNGLEAGMGTLILTGLGLISYLSGNSWLAIISFSMVAAIMAFLFFNWYPARIFPGNTFTYMVGAVIACIAILGNIEKLALLMFLPYFAELLLKLRGNLQKESFAQLLPDGSLSLPNEKWYGVEHIAISLLRNLKGYAREKEVVLTLLFIESIFVLIAFGIFYFGIGVF